MLATQGPPLGENDIHQMFLTCISHVENKATTTTTKIFKPFFPLFGGP